MSSESNLLKNRYYQYGQRLEYKCLTNKVNYKLINVNTHAHIFNMKKYINIIIVMQQVMRCTSSNQLCSGRQYYIFVILLFISLLLNCSSVIYYFCSIIYILL